jgi:hypothetical protein
MSRQLRNVLLGALILVFVTAGTAFAASAGSPFRLGVLNTINVLTRLTGTRAGPMLRITNNGTGTALQLLVKPGRPPLTTNSTTKVTNLNADSVDGLDSSAFLPVAGKAADSDRLDNLDSTRFMGATVTTVEAAQSIGIDFGGGNRIFDQACPPGTILLSGGPANIDIGTLMVESFPSGNTWRVRIQNDSSLDSFNVVVLCASR